VERVSREHAAVPRRRQTDGAQILVVEDNDDFRLLLELTLGTAGYRVDSAASSEEAIRLLRAHTYQLVLSDYSLPGLSGAWLISQAAAVSPRPLASMIITGDPDAPGIPRDIAVIRKPVDFDRLLAQVRTLVVGSATVSRHADQRAFARGEETIPHCERMPDCGDASDDSAQL
jgi:DNA-binding NtrC family response regulator